MHLQAVRFDDERQIFYDDEDTSTDVIVDAMRVPLSLTFQLTRNCNFRCVYCSEPPGIRSRPVEEMLEMVDKLAGMRRIIFSGGEPMAYKHFWTVLEHAQGKFEKVVLSTNAAMIGKHDADRLKELVDYVDITVDGPRFQHDQIRGQYDNVIRGLRRVAEAEIPLSVICVFMGRNRRVINYIAHTGDIFGAKKVKILTTIPKGKSKNLFEDFTSPEDIDWLESSLRAEKRSNGWKPRIVISDWMRIGEGHAILIEPDGRAVASPVWSQPECIDPFFDLSSGSAQELWAAFPYKHNHVAKYLERTMVVVE